MLSPGRFRHAEFESEIENLIFVHTDLEIEENLRKRYILLTRSAGYLVSERVLKPFKAFWSLSTTQVSIRRGRGWTGRQAEECEAARADGVQY